MLITDPGKYAFLTQAQKDAQNNTIITPDMNSGLNKPQIQTPTPTKPQIQSSSQPIMNVQQNQAQGAAASAITTPTQPSNSLDFFAQQVLDQQKAGLTTANTTFNEALRLNKLDYDATLAQNNFTYQNALSDLSKAHNRATQSAEQTAASLNPYSGATQSATAKGYTETINQIYQDKEGVIRQQAQLAQQALEAGNQRAFSQAQTAMNSAIAEANKGAFDAVLKLQSEARQRQEFDLNFGQKERALDSGNMQKAVDDFRIGLSTLNYTPEFVDQMVKSGQIEQDPTYRSGLEAYGPDAAKGIINAMKQGSLAQKKQLDLQQYREQQTALAQERMANAAEKQTNAQRQLAAAQEVANVQNSLVQRGIKPGTSDYAFEVARATGSNPRYLNAAQETRYTQLGTMTNQLAGLKTNIDAVNKNSTLGNIIFSRLPKDVQSLTDNQRTILNTELKSISGVVGKSVFGESGNLSNSDIQRVLDRLPTGGSTEEVRNGLYKGLLDVMKTNAINQLTIDSAYHNTAGYVPFVQQFTSEAERLSGSSNSNVTLPKGWTVSK